MPDTPSESDPHDATPIARLCEQDAEVLDALLAARAQASGPRDQASGPRAQGSGPLEPSATDGPMPPDSAERLKKLNGVLALLDAADFSDHAAGLNHTQAMTPPADLVAQTVLAAQARSREERQRTRFAQQVQMLSGPQPSIGLSFRQLLTAAAVFIVSVSLLLPVLSSHQDRQERALCEANLSGLGAAIGSYALSNDGQLPRQDAQPGRPWWSIGQDPSQSNSAQLFVLVRQDFLNVNQMMCPSHRDITDDELTVLGGGGFVDFQRPGQISYSYANQFTGKPMYLDTLGDRPIVSDKNPLFVVRNNQMGFDRSVPLTAPSVAHRSKGHNYLRATGSVAWSTTPEIEVAGQLDNIWIIQGTKTYTGKEVPASHDDAFLSP